MCFSTTPACLLRQRVGLLDCTAVEQSSLSEAELSAWAERLGSLLQPGDVVLLEGPMGAGKTTFTRALARGLAVDRPDRVCSPTFNICLRHAGPRPLVHVDLFRLAEPAGDAPPITSSGSVGASAFEALGLDALVEESVEGDAVLVVEWADLWRDPPADHLRVILRMDGDRRGLVIGASGPRHAARMARFTGDDAA
jgi:tRNA threonylcarbamoyladenosine biosynthesis protein TsaE